MNAMSRFGWTPDLSLWQEPGTLFDTISTIQFTDIEGAKFFIHYTPKCGRRVVDAFLFDGQHSSSVVSLLLLLTSVTSPAISAEKGIASSQSSSIHAHNGYSPPSLPNHICSGSHNLRILCRQMSGDSENPLQSD